jgi:hypothetical protein
MNERLSSPLCPSASQRSLLFPTRPDSFRHIPPTGVCYAAGAQKTGVRSLLQSVGAETPELTPEGCWEHRRGWERKAERETVGGRSRARVGTSLPSTGHCCCGAGPGRGDRHMQVHTHTRVKTHMCYTGGCTVGRRQRESQARLSRSLRSPKR